MKISKLFHWLYAILMFLPIMVFIPNAFYYGFNEQAEAQEKTELVPVYYETNVVNSVDDILIGNIYYWLDNFAINNANQYKTFGTIKPLVEYLTLNSNFDLNLPMTLQSGGSTIALAQELNGNTIGANISLTNIPIVFETKTTYLNLIFDKFTNYNGLYIKEYQPLTTNMSITDSMSYAWDSVWQNSLFSWSYDSFLTQPFLYITNLFNVPATNTLVYCLSYWLNISIIWLVFDVVIYVPLLVHRWLDKGIVE